MGTMFKDKVVLVAGSGQGVGRAVALAFAAEGAKVVTNNRKPGSTKFLSMTQADYDALSPERKKAFDEIMAGLCGDAETTAQTIIDRGGQALPLYCDIRDYNACAEMVDKIIRAWGDIHILVNVAGGFGGGPIENMTEEKYDAINNIKPKGYFNLMRHVVPHMLRNQYGRIINTTSKAMMGDFVKHTAYCTASAGVVGLTQGAACELFHRGITVNAFGPWARTRASYEGMFNSVGEERMIPGQRAFPTADETPDPEAVCPFVLYLASDYAKDVTGTVFTLAGNSIAMHQFPSITKSITKAGKEYWTMDELVANAEGGLFKGYQNILHYQ